MTGDLTAEQRAVADAPPESRLVVFGPAGSGKTDLLAARVASLVTAHGVNPGDEMLALTFTRAATREIGARLKGIGGAAANARASTFDSFVSRLLFNFDDSRAWESEDYDGRIRLATALMERSEEAQRGLRQVRHILVDEIQDLVGDRAALVLALLRLTPAGFTVLGDPAQAIYGFQQYGEQASLTSSEFLSRLLSEFTPPPTLVKLTARFRARTPLARIAEFAGDELTADKPDYARIRHDLEVAILGVPSLTIKSALGAFGADGTSVVLTRYNGQALFVSGLLHDHGVAHRLQQAAEELSIVRWVGSALGFAQFARVGRTAVEDWLSAVPSAPDPGVGWRILKKVDRRPTLDLDLTVVADRIRTRFIPDELTYVPPSPVVVSTVHRAKGLEFDRVFLYGLDHPADENPLDEETRLLYVAATRARDDIFVLNAPSGVQIRSRGQQAERWIQFSGRERVEAMEIRPDDVHTMDPAGAFLLDGVDVRETQRYLAHSVADGDPVDLVRIRASMEGQPRAFYRIDHGGRPIGATSERFAADLYATLRRSRDPRTGFPAALSHARVYAVETIGGSVASARRSGLNPAGIWLRPRLFGLARLEWGDPG